MKKAIFALLALLTVFAMVSCSNPADPPPFIPPITTQTVTFNANGGTFTGGGATSTVTVVKGTAVTAPAVPVKTATATETYAFGGWYTSQTTQTTATVYDFDTPVTADIILYAKWNAIPVGAPPDDGTYVIFNYENGSTERVEVELGETIWSQVLAALPVAKRTDTKAGDFVFAYWKDASGTRWSTGSTIISQQLVMTAVFWSTGLTATTDALEKVWLNNTQFAIYEFDLDGRDWTTITHISADFRASAAVISTINTRPIRPMGPYFYSDTPTTASDGWKYYGDFVPDANGAYATKFNSSGSVGYTGFNKFHPFLLNNKGGWNSPDWDGLNGYKGGKGGDDPDVAGSAVTADTWFNVKIATSGYAWSDGTNSPARVKGFIDADTSHAVLSADTNFNKVYFGFGIANSANPDDKEKGYTASVATDGITTLVKDVAIYFEDGTVAVGRIPAFPKRTQTIEGGVSTIVPGTGTTSQVFAAYIYKVQYNWRGAPGATIVPPTDPTYTYVPPIEYPQATVDHDYNTPTLTLFQNDQGKAADDTRKRVTVVTNTVTFDVQADDYNDGDGKYGGGGFQIAFSALALPTIEGVSDYRSYKRVILNITISSDFVGGDKQVIFSTPGTDIVSVNGSANKYITIGTAGETKDFIINTSAMPSATGIGVRVNNWQATNIPITGTLTVNSIIFSKDE